MFSQNDKISLRQLQILLLMDIFGTGVIILPRKASLYASRDGWIATLAAALLAALCTFIITNLGKMFPKKSFFEYASIIVSKPIAFLLALGFVIKIITGAACEVRFFGEIIKHVMLYNTPFGVICICLLAVSAYCAGKGYETRARTAEILIPLIFIPMVFVFSLACFDIDFTNVMPILQSPPQDIGIGGFYCLYAFSGIEFLLLCHPYLVKPEKTTKPSIIIVLLTGIFMSVVTFITIARFGPENILKQVWPVLEMMDTVTMPGSFIERQEALIMSFWILSVFATLNAGLFFSSILIKSVVKKGKHSYYTLLVVILIFLLSLYLKDIETVYILMDITFITFGISYMFIIPLLLLIIAKLRGLSGYEKNSE